MPPMQTEPGLAVVVVGGGGAAVVVAGGGGGGGGATLVVGDDEPPPPPVGVIVGLIGTVPSDGVALHVATCNPTVSDARPSCASGSGGPSGTVPT
jgi:hypothetical protein